MRRCFLVTALLGALGVVATFAALAYACTPQAYIDIPGASGPAGTSVTITGRAFVAAPVEITWSGGGVLGTATGPDFTVTVQIPEAAPGVYYISAMGRDTASGVIGRATRAFEVVAPPAPTVVETPAAQAPVATAQLETSGATRPRSSATRGERGQRADARTPQKAEAAAPVAETPRTSVVADPVARAGGRERTATRASTASRERSAPATRTPPAVRRDRPYVAAPPAGGPAAPPAEARAAERKPAADAGPGWLPVAGLALLGCGVLALLMATASRVARVLAARRRVATEPPVDEVVLPDDLLERLDAVLDEVADEAAGRAEHERRLEV
jgi:hypothetical protein